MSTAIIVVSLPSLKSLIVRSNPTNTYNRSTSGYVQTRSGKPTTHRGGTSQSHVQGGRTEDEVELVFLDQKPSLSPTVTAGGTETSNIDNAVMVTTGVTITREVF
jgi:hypothetical protein